ncbi:MAG: hypothetical protein HQ518_20215 [Rhodopirellula sp.]|nr:hypothetical protein [Rhodopirellula sp.]
MLTQDTQGQFTLRQNAHQKVGLLVSPQVFIGVAIAALSVVGFRCDQWFVHRTTKGQRLKAVFGERKAIWIWRGFLLSGVVFGSCLATGQVNPMTWNQ